MTTESNILTAQFPRAFRGYSPLAVDDFIRQIGSRLDTLQAQLDQQTARADQLEGLLDTANNDLAAFIEKEMAISHALVAMEQRRVSVEQELEVAHTEAKFQLERLMGEAHADAEKIRMNARNEAESMLNQAQWNADEAMAHAQTAVDAQEERLRALCAEYEDTTIRIRRTLEAQLSLLPTSNATLANLSINGIAITNSAEMGYEEAAHAA